MYLYFLWPTTDKLPLQTPGVFKITSRPGLQWRKSDLLSSYPAQSSLILKQQILQ